jgi:transposase
MALIGLPTASKKTKTVSRNNFIHLPRIDAAHPDGCSRFCDQLREFERRLPPVMCQHHAIGEMVFVDYSGKKI